MKVIFFGTPKIAATCLQSLIDLKLNIVCVACQPDRKKDRKNNFVYSEVKQLCIKKKLKYIQPENINLEYDFLKLLKPDIIITCAYGQFIKEEILKLPKYKCVNLHASILPKLRGGAPIHNAIISGEKETGISLMYMDKKMDAGNIIKINKIPIEYTDTYSTLYKKLENICYSMIQDEFFNLTNLNVYSYPQGDNYTLGLNIKKESTFIDFSKTSKQIYDLIRGLNNKPLAKFNYEGIVYNVYDSEETTTPSNEKPGTILSVTEKGIEIATSTFNIYITMIQKPGKIPMSIKDLINGNSIFLVGKVI